MYSADGSFTYEWDAENRLSRVWLVDPTPGQDEEGDRRVDFVYDYMGRRVRKVVEEHDGSAWVKELDRRFVYYNWLLLLELDGLNGNAIVRKYTWGLDLAGLAGQNPNREGGASIHGAGGIGGLLATYDADSSKSYVYFHDANGNVGQLIDRSDGSLDAKYEYDAYGNTIASGGDYANANPFRFSTKYFDGELDYGATSNDGLYYFGYRYYLPRVGRWINRDPMEEVGGVNLYGSVGNYPTGSVDPHGLFWDTLWDVVNVVYDGAKIVVGVVTDNPALTAEAKIDLIADTVALAIPFAPAGSTKIVRILGKGAGKAISGATKITIAAQKTRKLTAEVVSPSVRIGREFEEAFIRRYAGSIDDAITTNVRVTVQRGGRKLVDAQIDVFMRDARRFYELKDWARITPTGAKRIREQFLRQRRAVFEINDRFNCSLTHGGLIIADRTKMSARARRILETTPGLQVHRFSEFRFDIRYSASPCR